MFRTYL